MSIVGRRDGVVIKGGWQKERRARTGMRKRTRRLCSFRLCSAWVSWCIPTGDINRFNKSWYVFALCLPSRSSIALLCAEGKEDLRVALEILARRVKFLFRPRLSYSS